MGGGSVSAASSCRHPQQLPTNPITTTFAAVRLSERGLLRDDRVDMLEIVTIEELKLVEAVQEADGPTWRGEQAARDSPPQGD